MKISIGLVCAALALAWSGNAAPTATGFVTTSGQSFQLNGEPFAAVGCVAFMYHHGLSNVANSANSYWFRSAVAKDEGNLIVQTRRGFNEVTSPSGDYYQSWSGSTPTVNTGATGLQNFDNVVAAAKANGLRLVVALTNNWSDYGGMDVYTAQILGSGQPHDAFYTNAEVITAYKNYVNTFVGRYLDEPTIMAWELANEPRCSGSSTQSSGNCTTETITAWASDLSSFIKSIDSNHLVAIGDEGFFNEPANPSYPYQGTEGIDFDANLAIDTIDFGTFHASLPRSWGVTTNVTGWGSQWVIDHAASQANANKPVIMEEFGVTSDQESTYSEWYDAVLSSGLTGDLIWQAGSHLSTGDTPQDGYAIFPDNSVYELETSHAAALKARG
ncbi:glycoside hydrolase superfamily [Amylostereum chailletii]|nr:glycoside hydrolase superfamily [Amylostereum chailletii]